MSDRDGGRPPKYIQEKNKNKNNTRRGTSFHGVSASGGGGLQIWKVDASILNNQTRTTEKWWCSSWYSWKGSNNSSS